MSIHFRLRRKIRQANPAKRRLAYPTPHLVATILLNRHPALGALLYPMRPLPLLQLAHVLFDEALVLLAGLVIVDGVVAGGADGVEALGAVEGAWGGAVDFLAVGYGTVPEGVLLDVGGQRGFYEGSIC